MAMANKLTFATEEKPGAIRTRQPLRVPVGIAAIVLLILAYYLWTAGTNGAPFITRVSPEYYSNHLNDEIYPERKTDHYGFYNLLSDAFLSGKLSIPVEPRPELLALENPYDHALNVAYALHDATLYKGKYYLYFGPVPSIILFIPARLLFGVKITEPFACAIFSFAAFGIAILILCRVLKRFPVPANPWLLLASILALGLSNSMPYLLRRPIVYEVAITGGMCFSLLGIWLFLGGWRQTPGLLTDTLASLSWGLAVGCRAIYIVCGGILFIGWLRMILQTKPIRPGRAILAGIALGAPFATSIFLLGLYNYLRFGSWTEFGFSYQLTGPYVIEDGTYYRLANTIPGAFLSLFTMPEVTFTFPFLQLNSGNYPWSPPRGYLSIEPMGGLFAMIPITLCLFALAWNRVRRVIGAQIFAVSGMGFCIFAFEVFMFPAVTMRYQADYVFPLLIGALLIWLYLDGIFSSGAPRRIVRTWGLFALAAGIAMHIAVGFSGYYKLFMRSHPQTFFSIAEAFSPLSRLLGGVLAPSRPTIIGTYSPVGGGVVGSNIRFSWLGDKGIHFLFYAPKTETLQLSADFLIGPETSSEGGVRLTAAGTGQPKNPIELTENKRCSFRIQLRPGVNHVIIDAVPIQEAATGSKKATIDRDRLVAMANLEYGLIGK